MFAALSEIYSHAMTANKSVSSGELGEVLERAGRRFHREEGGASGSTYRAAIRFIERSHDDPGKVARQSVDLLYTWGGIRKPDSLRRPMADRFEAWLRLYRPKWTALAAKRIESLSDDDLLLVLDLAGSLAYPIETFEVGKRHWTLMTPTAWGKLLHFILPNAVILWDEGQVRNSYGLDDDPYSFVCYQAFARALSMKIQHSHPGGLVSWVQRHAAVVRTEEGNPQSANLQDYMEPAPKLIDELAYDCRARDAALSLVGRNPAEWHRFFPR